MKITLGLELIEYIYKLLNILKSSNMPFTFVFAKQKSFRIAIEVKFIEFCLLKWALGEKNNKRSPIMKQLIDPKGEDEKMDN